MQSCAMNFSTHYHLSGLASAFFVTLSLTGLALQVRFIRRRKKQFAAGGLAGERPTSTLSLNRFSATYLGYYALFAYGLCLARLNHYLVWPRVLALLLTLAILHAIMADRKSPVPAGVFAVGVVLFLASPLIRLLGAGALAYSVLAAQGLVVMATALFLQGAVHQVIKIRRAGRTGGLSLPMHQLFFLKDVSTILFGLAMGVRDGWPLLLFNGISLVMQSVIMWHFHWVKTSRIAGERSALLRPD